MQRKRFTFDINIPWPSVTATPLRSWLPTRGNVLFTLLMIALLLWAQTAGALPVFTAQSTHGPSYSTIAYQGRLADADGAPITATVGMIFRLYSEAIGGAPLWEEQWTGSNSAQVSDGLFNVMLGSLAPIPANVITGHDTLFLGITVGSDDEMAPRVQLGTVPFAVQALTVPDGSVTTAKIADGAVTHSKAPTLVASPRPGTKVAYGQGEALQLQHDKTIGWLTIQFDGYGFSTTPTTLCSVAGWAGFYWTCHVEYEHPGGFSIGVKHLDGAVNWTSVPVRWVAFGE